MKLLKFNTNTALLAKSYVNQTQSAIKKKHESTVSSCTDIFMGSK